MWADVAPKGFVNWLEALDMAPDSVSCPGLVRVDDATLTEKQRVKAPLEEIVALERALGFKFKPNYIYFRRFLERPPMAVAYVYDWTERRGEARSARKKGPTISPPTLADDLTELHRHVWSAGEIPLVYVFLPTEVHIYHHLQGPEEVENGLKNSPLATIAISNTTADELKQFSARRLDDGTFWEENAESKSLGLNGSAFMALSEEIAICRDKLVNERKIPDALVRRLLLLFVLVKYLEERRDPQGNGVFPPGTFASFAQEAVHKKVKSFVDLLRWDGNGMLAFFDTLAQAHRFNGDVFRLNDSERAALLNKKLSRIFADLLDGRKESKQRTFWHRYAFEELPIELIGHLYERFIPRPPGAVDTPPFLVNFILDEVLPLSEETPESFRLIDPACGSGVFLVGAFRRLVHRWRRKNNHAHPDADVLKQILRDHIFGVDMEGEPIHLTMFSLSLALCDFLKPRVIWDELHFDRLLDENLFVDDFFAHFPRWRKTKEFDLVVGNPPFRNWLTAAEHEVVHDLRKEFAGFHLPDAQAALLFLKCAVLVAKPGGQSALVQPSGPLLHNENSSRFRKSFFASAHVTQIVDLAHLNRVLLERPTLGAQAGGDIDRTSTNPGDVPLAVIFAENH